MRKRSNKNEETLAGSSSAHRCSQAKCELVRTSQLHQTNFKIFSCLPYIKDLSLVGLHWRMLLSVVCTDLGQDSPKHIFYSVNKS